MHVDMDAFYASVEQLDNPELRGKPVIVGAAPEIGRGVVSAASYEAREFGIHSAQPISQAYKACPHGIFLRPRFARYKELSDKMFEILHELSPNVEPLSIDEAFVDLTGTERLHGEPEILGKRVKRRILQETGLVASIGIAPNKFLAKLASDFDKPDGFVVIPEDGVKEFLGPLPISRLWGVGPKAEKSLHKFGIKTVGELARYSPEALEKEFGEHGRALWQLAQGIDDRPVCPESERKGISKEYTFDEDERDSERKIATFRRLADRLSARMRKESISGRTITVKIRHSDFTTITRGQTLSAPINSSEDIFRAAVRLAEPELDGAIRLLGIRVTGRTGEEGEQLPLFDNGESERTKRFEKALDYIHERFGDGAITRGTDVEKSQEED